MIELGVVVLELVPDGDRLMSRNTRGGVGASFLIVQARFALVHLSDEIFAFRPLIFIAKCLE